MSDANVNQGEITYNPASYTFTLPFSSSAVAAGAATLVLESAGYSGGTPHWLDAYGGEPWTTAPGVYTATVTIP